ncbi:THAP domain-containing protein 4-like [Gymnodraco acuticeps]|uniref:THAP domain-containing protein 4-like n=1 Tax=Gymnodraco acuticeps TaxID=8218 RepID=A0A6P8UWU4_GYMAC|nr:THAP domain-containing protein 4-like [Gymnodraco acuticeps]
MSSLPKWRCFCSQKMKICQRHGQSKQRTRKDWEPTKYSVLCSEHFTRDSFDESALLRAQMGIATKRTLILKKGAIPTVFPRVGTSAVGQLSTSTSRPARSAFAMRERKRKVEELLAESEVESSSFASTEESMEMALATDTDMAPEQERQSQDQACQTDWTPTATVSIKTQTGKQLTKTKTQSKACQVTPEMLTASLPVPGRQRKLKVHGTRDPATPDQPPQAASSTRDILQPAIQGVWTT